MVNPVTEGKSILPMMDREELRSLSRLAQENKDIGWIAAFFVQSLKSKRVQAEQSSAYVCA